MAVPNVNKTSDGMYDKAYMHVRQCEIPTQIATAGAATYTAADILGGIILRDCAGSSRSDVLPTAALLIGALRGEKIGDAIDVLIINDSDANETITVTPGSGGTMPQVDATQVIPQNTSRLVRIVLTNVTAGSEAYKAYM